MISISMLIVIQFLRNTTSAGEDLMSVMVFPAQLEKRFLVLRILSLFEWCCS